MKTKNPETHSISNNTIEANEIDYLFIKTSQIPNAGKGLYTVIDIFKTEIISLFKGEIISAIEAEKRVLQHNDRYFINLLDGTIMDSMNTDCFAKFANDAFGTSYKNNAKITLDDDGNVCLMATKNINPGDEIFCGYGKAYWKKHG